MDRAAVNDTMREMMAAAARWYEELQGSLVTGGTSNAYTLTTSSSHAALADQPAFIVRFDRANTGAATLAVDGLTAKSLVKRDGTALASGDIAADDIGIVVYNSTNDEYQIIGGAALALAAISAQTQGQVLIFGASGVAEAIGPGTDGHVLTARGAGSDAEFAANPFSQQLLHVRDEKSNGTDGGTFTSGAWRTRDLNTVKTNEITGASLSNDQITLPAGTYFCQAKAAAHESLQANKLRFRNVTDSTTELVGLPLDLSDTAQTGAIATVEGRFEIAGEKTFELQHRAQSGASTTGFGQATSFGEVEVYADVLIWKVG